jgi:hypothetical protein
MKLFFALLFSTILFSACNDASTATTALHKIDSNAVYIPIRDLIQEEISKVDSFSAGIQLRTSFQNGAENHYIKIDSFHLMASSFLNALPDRSMLQQNYQETNLFDESSGELTLMYTPLEETLPISTIVVYIEKGEFKDKVKRIYYEEKVQNNETIYVRKNTWKLGQYFIISEEKRVGNNAATQIVHKLIWDTELFNEE